MRTDRDSLLALYKLFPFHHHPLWASIKSGELPLEGVVRAEIQHCIRTRAGQKLRKEALETAKEISPAIFDQLLETYLEECTDDATGPSHLDLIERLVLTAGVTREQIKTALPTPGNSAAMALYKDIGERGAGCHMLGAGAVEFYYCRLSEEIYDAYLRHYKMTPEQAHTYKLHGPMDQIHADRAFAILDEAVKLHGASAIYTSVRDAFVATSLHYDGMYQAATNSNFYWDGSIE